MKYSLSILDNESLNAIPSGSFNEFILHFEDISKLGHLKLQDVDQIIEKLDHHQGVKIVLNIDILTTDKKLNSILDKLKENNIFEKFTHFRFLDKGVGHFIKTHLPNSKLQLILEHESHNLRAIYRWMEYFSPNLEKLILSNEIPYNILQDLERPDHIDIELLGSGKIEIFYSPRALLQPHFGKQKTLEYKVHSTDRPSSLRNLMTENQHGSFLFYERELYILDCYQELQEGKIDSLLICQNHEKLNILFSLIEKEDWQIEFKKHCEPHTKGFFKANRTDTQFKRLRNTKQSYDSNKKIGTIIHSKKQTHLIIQLLKEIEKETPLIFHTTEGMQIQTDLSKAQKLNSDQIEGTVQPGFYLLPWIPKVLTKTIITIA